jgi:hypothetical protein
MFEERGHLIQEHLERRGQPGCLVCDGTEWKVGKALYADEVRDAELVSAVCADCGYVMRFETDRISGWQEAAKPEDFSA